MQCSLGADAAHENIHLLSQTLPAAYVYGIYPPAHLVRHVRIWDLSFQVACHVCLCDLESHAEHTELLQNAELRIII